MSSFSKKLTRDKRGFSILELIVVLAIFAIMTTILITDIPNFREKSSLDLTINEVATYVRGAQVYGSSQKGAANVPVTYGIHFDKGSSTFDLFKDTYLPSGPNEEHYTLNNFKITDILVRHDNPQPYTCGLSNFETSYGVNPYTQNIGTSLEAKFVANGGSASIPGYDYADIMIRGIRNTNLVGCLRVYRNGQISPVSCTDSDSFGNGDSTCRINLPS